MKKDMIEINDKGYWFRTDLTFEEVEFLKQEYRKDMVFSKPNWWYRKNDFAMYFLRQIGIKLPIDFDIPEKEWYKIIPILRKYFITILEFKAIIGNCVYLAGGEINVTEDKWFTTYLLMKKFGTLNPKDIKKMDYKTARVLFIYCATEYGIKRNRAKQAADMFR